MSRDGFIFLQGDRKPIVIPGLGSFLVSVNGSTMATDHILVEFWAEGRERPSAGHVGYKPNIGADGRLDFGEPYTYNVRIGDAVRDWTWAAYHQALVLAEAFQVHDATGALWVIKDLCFKALRGQQEELLRAEQHVEMYEKMLADPEYPREDARWDREGKKYTYDPVSPEVRERRRAAWPAMLARARKIMKDGTSPDAVRRVQRIESTQRLLRTLYFSAPKRAMPPREIAQAALNMLEGAE